MIGQLTIAIYAYLVGNLSVTFWNMLFFTINTYQVIRLIRERRPITLPEYLQDLYNNVFSVMSRKEFLFFWHMGTIKEITDGLIIKQGEHQDELLLVLSGTVDVIKNGTNLAKLSRGSFIAEMSFLTGETATADIKPVDEVRYIAWSQEKIKHLDQINPELLIKIQNILGKDLVEKIKKASG